MSAGRPESQQDSQGICNKILFATDNLSTMVEEDNWFELEWRGVEESDKSFTRL